MFQTSFVVQDAHNFDNYCNRMKIHTIIRVCNHCWTSWLSKLIKYLFCTHFHQIDYWKKRSKLDSLRSQWLRKVGRGQHNRDDRRTGRPGGCHGHLTRRRHGNGLRWAEHDELVESGGPWQGSQLETGVYARPRCRGHPNAAAAAVGNHLHRDVLHRRCHQPVDHRRHCILEWNRREYLFIDAIERL